MQGLRGLFELHRHRGQRELEKGGCASGNHLTPNDDIKELRSTHRVELSQIDKLKVRTVPYPYIVCVVGSGRRSSTLQLRNRIPKTIQTRNQMNVSVRKCSARTAKCGVVAIFSDTGVLF